MAGRPRQFDRQEALVQAMEVFWDKGYEGTSVRDLLGAMGINRGSLYDTFGDKRCLFLEAMRHYDATVTTPLLETLADDGNPLENIRCTLACVAGTAQGCRGCMVTNTTIELAPHDEEVAAIMRDSIGRLEKGFRAALDRAVDQGLLGPQARTLKQARFLTTTLQGVVVLAKAGISRKVLRDAIDTAMSALR